MATMTSASLEREKEMIAKLVKKNLVIAQTFERIGDNKMAIDHFDKVHIFAQRIWAINSELQQSQIQ